MIVVISNRQVNPGAIDESLFGEGPNASGLDELRLAKAAFDDDSGWRLELLPEANLETGSLPSRQLFAEIMAGIRSGTYRKHWVLYIHGFNQTFRESLDTSHDISRTYDVDVIAFSWPSNPGGFVTDEYRRARQAARASANALDRTLDKLGSYLSARPLDDIQNCPVSINLLVHSMGNFLVENFVRGPIFLQEQRIFDNMIFHQADVDNQFHSLWIDRLLYGHRTYVTINEDDLILKASDFINPGRLGNTLRGLDSRQAIYLDFTEGTHVEGAHNLFLGVKDNRSVRAFFQRVFWGDRAEGVDGFRFDQRLNVFRLER